MGELIFALILGHYVADFPLQPDFVAKSKGKVFKASIGFHTLTAHAAIHAFVAGGIALALGYSWLFPAIAVGATHWLIDFGKSWEMWPESWRITEGAKWAGNPDARGLYGINVDQALHMTVIVGVGFSA